VDRNSSWDSYDARVARAKPKPEKTDWFLSQLPPNAEVLDFGSGIGRFAELMAQKSPTLSIDVLDARADRLSRHYDAVPQIKNRISSTFQDFRATKPYDGIWARSSLFFMPQQDLPNVLAELSASLKPSGALEFSFVGEKPEKGFDSFYPVQKDQMIQLVEAAGLTIEQTIDETNTQYGDDRIHLPTYIIRARKPAV
jgi:trans-aconitate methyltransferase